jgi:L-cysteine S-thiosulfotransferase
MNAVPHPRAMLPALLLAAAAAAQGAGGDAQRGAAIAMSRSTGLCVLCHTLPGQPEPLQGTLGPPLAGAGARFSADALRQRLLQPERFNPETVMPAYGRSDGLVRVAPAHRDRPLLTPQQIDDVVAYLVSLQ